MEYHAIFHKDNCVIRPANHGITDTEWEHSCRSVYQRSMTRQELETWVSRFNILNSEQWAIYIDSLTNPGVVPSNNFISTRVIRDKWDSDRTIY
jgi:hypothetical protein